MKKLLTILALCLVMAAGAQPICYDEFGNVIDCTDVIDVPFGYGWDDIGLAGLVVVASVYFIRKGFKEKKLREQAARN